jgi:hypothetical protein
MSDQLRLNLTRFGITVGIISGLAGLFGAWFILPYRMSAAEQAIKDVQSQGYADHSLLQRIDERTARMEQRLLLERRN